MFRRLFITGIAAMAAGGLSAAEGVKVRYLPATQLHWANATEIAVAPETADEDFTVRLKENLPFSETAWRIASSRIAIPAGSVGYAFDFEIYADVDWIACGTSEKWGTSLFFFDAKGVRLECRPLEVLFRKGGFARFRFSGELPAGAAGVETVVGIDDPNIKPKHRVTVRNSTMTFYRKGEKIPKEIIFDVVAPIVKSRFKSPTEDRSVAVKYEICDNFEVDWNSLAVTNCATKAAAKFTREGNVITLVADGPWEPGEHAFAIAVSDKSGNVTLSRKVFLIGRPPAVTSSSSLRDDGMVLVDGKPFFPIGLFGISPAEFNAWDIDRAFADLKRFGFNFGHTYRDARASEFHAAAAKNGFLLWQDARHACLGNDGWFLEKGRDMGHILSWYIGDDTAMNTKVSQLVDRDEAVRMLDGTRITCQADVLHGGGRKSSYQDYVNYSDVIMPELYHVYSSNRVADASCVRFVVRDMEQARKDIAKYSDGTRHHSIWPILQCFYGNSWKRHPDPDEISAMSFAALCHGANGITWFHYGGERNPEAGRRYSGMFNSRKDFAAMTNLVGRISSLSPVLLERSVEPEKAPEILEGPNWKPGEFCPVSQMVKRHGDSVWVVAVNGTTSKLRARLSAPVADREGAVCWENRRVKAAAGFFEDAFEPLAVHVYRFAGAVGATPKNDR